MAKMILKTVGYGKNDRNPVGHNKNDRKPVGHGKDENRCWL